LPNNAQLLTNRGTIFEALGDGNSALLSYKKSIKVDKDFGLAYYNAGNLYLKQHSWEKAIEFYNTALSINEKDDASMLNRGIAYLMLSDQQSAKKDFEKAIELNSGLSVAYSNLGYLYHFSGKIDLI
jgi:tetratricopeptide (TPR) repeat protein